MKDSSYAQEQMPSDQRRSVIICDRRPASFSETTVSIIFYEDGHRRERAIRVGSSTNFEDVVVGLVHGVSRLPREDGSGIASAKDFARFCFRKSREIYSNTGQAFRSNQALYDVRSFEPNNIAHLLLDILPLSLHAQSVLNGEMMTVFRDVRGPFRELLDILEVKSTFTSRRLEGQLVRVRGTRGLSAHDLLGVFDLPSITLIPEIYSKLSFTSPYAAEKVFIARRGARSLLNHAEVQRVLESYGYQTIYMEDYSVRDQLGIAAHAKHVVAIHGAGMAGLIMNRGLDSIVEFLPPNVYHDFFPVCFSRRVKQYVQLMPDFDERIQHCDWPVISALKAEPFSVNISDLERALDTINTGSR